MLEIQHSVTWQRSQTVDKSADTGQCDRNPREEVTRSGSQMRPLTEMMFELRPVTKNRQLVEEHSRQLACTCRAFERIQGVNMTGTE